MHVVVVVVAAVAVVAAAAVAVAVDMVHVALLAVGCRLEQGAMVVVRDCCFSNAVLPLCGTAVTLFWCKCSFSSFTHALVKLAPSPLLLASCVSGPSPCSFRERFTRSLACLFSFLLLCSAFLLSLLARRTNG